LSYGQPVTLFLRSRLFGSSGCFAHGNASYSNADPKLTQPIGNARALADELTRDGFQVEEGENLTKEASNAPSAVFTTR
jgi:hypothetical protein